MIKLLLASALCFFGMSAMASEYTGGQGQFGSLVANGRLTAQEFIQLNGLANVGWTCAPDGLVGRAADGTGAVQCLGGTWARMRGMVDAKQVVSTTSSCGNTREAETLRRESAPHVLSVQTFNVGHGTSVQLPKVKMADGTICQSYVASVIASNVDENPDEYVRIEVGLSKICGKAKIVHTGFLGLGKEEVLANLKSMRTETSLGYSVQRPDLGISN